MKVALFSGQGSQYVGMTADLAERFQVAKTLAARANEVLGYDLSDLMINGPTEVLTQTQHTQPALFVHEAMILAITNIGENVDAFAGHSLGEFSALYASGALNFEDALELVKKRATIMYETGKQIPGTMAAVVGLDNEQVAAICRELSTDVNNVIVPANYNSIGQIVVSGNTELVRASLDVFKSNGARMARELQVSGAFHSPLLTIAMQDWTNAVTATPFRNASKPVYNNTTALPEQQANLLQQAAIEQMVSPVLWTQTLQNLHANGFTSFIEVGPQAVLQGLVKRTLESVSIYGLDKAVDCERYLGNVGVDHGNA